MRTLSADRLEVVLLASALYYTLKTSWSLIPLIETLQYTT